MHPDSKSPSLSRRGFLAGSAALIGAPALASAGREGAEAPDAPPTAGAPFVLAPLPYSEDALDPHISARTMSFHYGKHHKGYVDKLNAAVQGSKFEAMSLETVVAEAAKDPATTGLFNNAAQAWNHAFYWKSLKPKGGGEPSGKIADRLKADLGGYEGFRKAFGEAAGGQFGSGWAWLVVEDGKLRVTKTGNADTPIAHGGKPLLVVDVWEHAYYLDYQNKRGDYVTAILDHLLNWDFAMENLG